MRANDPFGVQGEAVIAKSGIRDIFTPHTPINSLELFLGRAAEVKGIIAQINTPGQHSLLFGDRGVGKSSLANIACELLLSARVIRSKVFNCRCDSHSTFEHMIAAPLQHNGIDLRLSETANEHNEGGGASVGVDFGISVKAGVKSARKVTEKRGPIERPVSPAAAAHILSGTTGLLVIDELDAIESAKERRKLAEFIKHLSDTNSKFKILAVGIGATASDLIAGHQSVERCLKETKLNALDRPELRDIVVKGAKKAGLLFESSVIENIVSLSGGYPHFTHLLALKCAETAIVRSLRSISQSVLDDALIEAASEAVGSLRATYDAATMSHNTTQYVEIMCAAAIIPDYEFTAEQLRRSYEQKTGKPIKQAALNNYFKRLVSDNGNSVLVRRAKGVYSFRDPRMRPFIRIKNRLL